MPNPQALTNAAPAARTTEIYAQLLGMDDAALWQFQYNPEEIKYSRSPKYAEAPTAATSQPGRQYLYTEAERLELSNLLMASYCEGVSLRQSLDDLRALTVADTANGAYSPKRVYFVWGTERFGTATLEDLTVSVTLWLGGEPAEARVSFTLVAVPIADLTPADTAPPDPAAITRPPLTDRQREDGRKAAGEWLQANLEKLSPQVRDAVRSSRFRYRTTAAGEVYITDVDGTADLGLVGTWDGTTLDTTKGTLIEDATASTTA
jgi:hypothetical protein